VRTKHLRSVTYEHSDMGSKRGSALLPYGPVKAGLTTSPDHATLMANQLAQLMELLNSLESAVQNLNYKSFTLYDTLNTAIEDLRAALCTTQTDGDGTES